MYTEYVCFHAFSPLHLTDSNPTAPLAPLILGPTPAVRAQTMDALLEPLSVQACNAHLVIVILDLVFLALFPELGGAGEAVPEGWSGDADSPSLWSHSP
jgi:hypothetical protein